MVDLGGAVAITFKRSSLDRTRKFFGAAAIGGAGSSASVAIEDAAFGAVRPSVTGSGRGARIVPKPASEGAGFVSSRPHQTSPATTTQNASAGKNQVRC